MGRKSKALADRLTSEFGNGSSQTNLKLMRQFYIQNEHRIGQSPTDYLAAASKGRAPTDQSPTHLPSLGKSRSASRSRSAIGDYSCSQSLAARVQQSRSCPFTLSGTHYVLLLAIKNPDERSFYEIESTEQSWTVRELNRQYNSSLYERLALSRDKAGIRKLAKQGQRVSKPEDLLKEPLVLEFLGLEEEHRYSESDLETAIINQIERFLLEVGKGFLFEARQRRFTFDDEHYWVDLVFYNRLLRCYVLIDLKLGKLTHQDLGQMQMYVNYFDQHEKMPGEAATIGIILCKQESKAMVRMTLPKDANIHAREYQLYLPSKQELRRKLVEWAENGDI